MKEFFQECLSESLTIKEIDKQLCKINTKVQLTGLIGSALAMIASSLISSKKKSHIFILNNKEDAIYFSNDIGKLITEKALLYSSSKRKPYLFDEKENEYDLQRAEAVNYLKKSENTIIVTYAEAIFEKIPSKESLEKNTLIISKEEERNIEELEEKLVNLGFDLN